MREHQKGRKGESFGGARSKNVRGEDPEPLVPGYGMYPNPTEKNRKKGGTWGGKRGKRKKSRDKCSPRKA